MPKHKKKIRRRFYHLAWFQWYLNTLTNFISAQPTHFLNDPNNSILLLKMNKFYITGNDINYVVHNIIIVCECILTTKIKSVTFGSVHPFIFTRDPRTVARIELLHTQANGIYLGQRTDLTSIFPWRFYNTLLSLSCSPTLSI